MSDIFTKLYLNIGKFKYPNQMMIENEDVYLFEKSLKKAIINPLLFLAATVVFSKLRPTLLKSLKEYLYKNRPESVRNKLLHEVDHKFSQINNNNKNFSNQILNIGNKSEEINKPNISNDHEPNRYHEAIMQEFDKNDVHITNPSNLVLKINTSRKITSKKSEKIKDEEILNMPRTEPKFREEFFTFGKGARAKASRLLFFKKYLNKNIKKESFNNKALHILVNSKLVYLPFFIFTFLTLFDFGYVSFGLYLKYQPLIDTYYYYNQNNSNIISNAKH